MFSDFAMHWNSSTLIVGLWLLLANVIWASDPSSAEFFESRIRPVLIQNCYECHSSTKICEANLALDFREGLLRGGDLGPAIVPGRPDDSLLLQVIEHRSSDLKMPPSGLQLSIEVLGDFRKWIAAGAYDPREVPPSADEATPLNDWQKILDARKSWWSFQPIQQAALPFPDSAVHPVDQFINQKLTALGLAPSTRASNQVLIRRVFWNLTGLPPGREELHRWDAALAEAETLGGKDAWSVVWEQLVDHLLQAPGFGERWARHWMDWIRYAESHGSEGDPPIANAWMYRDYLIRAMNESIPMDEMIREHIAGDLLPPRLHPDTKLNQAFIGTAHWRMVFHGFSPVDAKEERVRFTDDQINAFSKAFLGITLSCARCHDHKFDPISQADYYAVFGVLSSCRPGRQPADSEEILRQHHDELRQIKIELRQALVERWKQSMDQLPQRLGSALDGIVDAQDKDLTAAQHALKSAWTDRNAQKASVTTTSDLSKAIHWDLTHSDDLARWYPVGPALEDCQTPGDLVVAMSGDQALSALHSGGASSRLLSDKEAARLDSPDFICPPNSVLWVLCEGDGGATLRYAVEDYPRSGTIYPVYPLKPGLRWLQSDLSYWEGDSIHVELSNAADAPLLTGDQPRSWFRVQQVWVLPKGTRPPERESLYRRLSSETASTEQVSREDWIQQIGLATTNSLERWIEAGITADEAELLDLLVRNDILPTNLSQSWNTELVQRYRQIEAEMPVATRIACLEETGGQDFPLLVRGDHRFPAEKVPRRFLEAIDGRPYATPLSGRLELADNVLDERNPLTRRVLVNRVWQHLFGLGIVSTSDNLGRLGAEPTHPELLDWLAIRLTQLDWSLKKLIREILMSDTWLRSSQASPEALAADPDNRLLGRANVRRYEAEAIRDALLSVTGSLDSAMYGPPQSADGKRRSIYLPVIRNSLVPFLRIFDFPEPFSTVGKRDQTNVPAQSLALMNDPLVASLARRWAEDFLTQEPDWAQRIQRMLEAGLSRAASAQEISVSLQFMEQTRKELRELVTKKSQLSEQIAGITQVMSELEFPVRASLRMTVPQVLNVSTDPLANSVEGQSITASESLVARDMGTPTNLPNPLLAWDFTRPLDSRLGASLELIGSAEIADGALVLRAGGYALTKKQSGVLRQKTLTAWVQLDNLQQRGSGVLSVQSHNGELFDSIVFGEETPAHWLAGSNFFMRTQSLSGDVETTADQTPVHLAMVYQAGGKILAYRNGQPYGQAYQSSGLQEYASDEWIVSLGLRHLPATNDKTLSGKILSAAVYNQALSPQQVATLAKGPEATITQEELLAAMQNETRQEWHALNNKLKGLLSEQTAMDDLPFIDKGGGWQEFDLAQLDEGEIELLCWTDFARAVFTLKEFIYVP